VSFQEPRGSVVDRVSRTRRAFGWRYAAVGVLAAVGMAAIVGLGYSATAQRPAAAVQYEYPTKKVTICHHARPKAGKKAKKAKVKHVTISVSRNALRSHLRHGDTLGSCSTAKNKRAHSRPAHVRRWHPKGKG
jgi:uncharacterized membrane protein YraQ (UPF0718 family)